MYQQLSVATRQDVPPPLKTLKLKKIGKLKIKEADVQKIKIKMKGKLKLGKKNTKRYNNCHCSCTRKKNKICSLKNQEQFRKLVKV